MIKHVILWKLKDYDEAQKEQIKSDIKESLEGLIGVIPGLLEMKIHTSGILPTSKNADLMLDSTFEDEAALANYAVHPEHVSIADNKVRPYVESRSCLDFEI